ncbi:MAG TPA: T9SS type A sorting domain-containing protein [Bacteroidota bacterium]|nr:T9SS type A sorting domain-containing protein [Bacteroidota bacterium]
MVSNTNTPILTVDVLTADSLRDQQGRCIPKILPFQLVEHDFFRSNQVITEAVEIPIGFLELCKSVDSVVYFRSDIIRAHHWNDTTAGSYAKIINDNEFWNPYMNRKHLDTLDIRISHSQSDVTVLLDAVCLSSPRAFALFNPEHPLVQPGGNLAAWQWTRNGLLERLERILYSDGNPNSNVRFIDGPEHGWRSGFWPVASVAQQFVAERSENRTTLICSAGYTENPMLSSAMSGRFASAYYGYPIRNEYPIPTLDSTKPWIYHELVNRYNHRGFVDIALRYRMHSEFRKHVQNRYPWLPYVQNHSNLFTTDVPEFDDGDPLREPSAAELRLQCNLALASNADGLYFYQFVSWPWKTTTPYWPLTRGEWELAVAANPFLSMDPNAGSLGFLDGNLQPRRMDWNGESKWDSAVVYVNKFLRPMGNFIKEQLEWQDMKIWSIRNHSACGVNEHVNDVRSFRIRDLQCWDTEDSTFVLVGEFRHRDTDDPYLFVVNGRTHPGDGDRFITVKLRPGENPEAYWKVTNVITEDIWIVRPVEDPELNLANGFTDSIPMGAAMLYRLELVEHPRQHIPVDVPSMLYVTAGADLSLTADNAHTFRQGKALYVEGVLSAYLSEFRAANEVWDGIIAANEGSVYLSQCQLEGAGAVAGSGGMVSIVDSRIENAQYALRNLGGTLYSTNTVAPSSLYGHVWMYGGLSKLLSDKGTGSATPARGTAVDLLGWGSLTMRQCRMENFKNGVRCSGGLVRSNNYAWERGWNVFNTDSTNLMTQGAGTINFGTANNGGMQNCFTLQNLANGHHVWAEGGYILSDSSYWNMLPPKVVGNASINMELSQCLAPFTGPGGAGTLSKSTAPPPPNNPLLALRQALADSNYTMLRAGLSGRMSTMRGAALDAEMLDFIRFDVLAHPALEDWRDTLLVELLLRPGLREKLFAADVLLDARRFDEALELLESYSFVASPSLYRDQLMRTAVIKPHVRWGGFAEGLRTLDTLRSLTGNDTSMFVFFDLYPKLYARVFPSPGTTRVPKTSRLSSLLDAILPHDIAIEQSYPNPFSDVTSFTFRLGKEMNVRLAVYDAMGRERAVLVNGPHQRGVHSVPFRSGTLPSGLYFYRIDSDAGTIQRKMILAR